MAGKILEKLCEGGMGVVCKAQDKKLKRFVALKFLPINRIASQEEISRFEQEAEDISALNHPKIETIYDADEVNGQKCGLRHPICLVAISGCNIRMENFTAVEKMECIDTF